MRKGGKGREGHPRLSKQCSDRREGEGIGPKKSYGKAGRVNPNQKKKRGSRVTGGYKICQENEPKVCAGYTWGLARRKYEYLTSLGKRAPPILNGTESVGCRRNGDEKRKGPSKGCQGPHKQN